MSYSSDFFNAINKKKKKEEEEVEQKTSKNSYSNEYFSNLQNGGLPSVATLSPFTADIVPVKDTKKEKDEEKEKWYEGWFDKGAFDDGYQFGDVTKTILGTTADLTSNLGGGLLEMGEGAVDALAFLGGASVNPNLPGSKMLSEGIKDFVKKDLYDGEKIASYLVSPTNWALKAMGEDYDELSVLGEKTDSLVQSGGQLLGTVGLQAVGVPWFITTGVTSFGGGVAEAFNEGASYGEAGLSAAITAGADILTEKLFGGSGLGEKGLINLDGLTKGISKKAVKALADFGVDVTAEGLEEVGAGILSNLGTALYKEDNLKDILFNEEAIDEYIQGFIGGAVLGGGMNAGKLGKSIGQGTDYRTGLTANEQKVFDKAYNDAIAEAEKGGKKLSKNDKAKIHDNVMENLKKGYITTDSIEEILGGETFGEYKSFTEQEKALADEISKLENLPKEQITVKQSERLSEAREELKNLTGKDELKTKLTDGVKGQIDAEAQKLKNRGSYLAESYNEIERKKQAFTTDLTKYKGRQKEAVERAVKSGVLNNTNRSHELVDVLSKIEADKSIVFDYTDNAKLKESGFAVEGKTVNGYVKNGSITLNIQSSKAWQSTVGHEITHVLEGTEAYSELQKALFSYAESKGELESRRTALTELYKGMDADIDAELTADLVGDYLFSDSDFIKGLTTNKTVFQKVYDEIKYLCKVATGKEQAQIEKVKREFDKVWNDFVAEDAAETDGKVNYSVSQVDGIDYVQAEKNIFTKEDGTLATEKEVFNSLVGKTIALSDGEVEIVNRLPDKNMYEELYRRQPKYRKNVDDVKQLNSDVNYNMEELLGNSEIKNANIPDKNERHIKQGITSFDTRTVKFYDGNKAYDIEFSIATLKDGKKVAYAKKFFGYDAELTKKIQTAESSRSANTAFNQQSVSEGIITQNSEKSRGEAKYSIGEDSKIDNAYSKAVESGNTEIAQKILDETAKKAGYDIKAYHGTGYDFTVFDKSRQGDNYEDWGRLGKGFYFAPTSREAETWAELSKGSKNKVMPVYLRSENMIDSFEALPDNLKDTIPENWDSLTRRLAEKYAYNYIEYMQEFGYNVQEILIQKGYDGINGHTEFVVFDPEQVKSADAITYDDKGNIIPLSQRFNKANEDIRYSLSNDTKKIDSEYMFAVGNYSTPLKDLYLAPTKEDIAPVKETATPTEFDAPLPEGYAPMTDAVDDKTLKGIAKTLKEVLYLDSKEAKAIQEIVQEYSTTETPNKDNLFNIIKEKFGEKVWREKNEELTEIKRFLRTTKVNVSPKIKSEIADYSDFRKGIGSKLGTSKDGISVDVAYQQLVEMYPDYFSEDIWNETDQFLRMADVASMDLYQYESHPLDDDTIQQAVDIISNEVRGYKENLVREAVENEAREALDSIAPPKAEQRANGSRGDALLNQSLDNFPIKTVDDRLKEKIRAAEAELADNKQLRREIETDYGNRIAEAQAKLNAKKNKNTKEAIKLSQKISRLQKMKDSIEADYAKKISDLEARTEKMKSEEYNRAMHKQDKMQDHAKWAEDLIGDTSTWKDKKIGLQYAVNTERRNLRDIVRDENGNKDIARADAIDDAINGRYNREEAAKKRELAKVRGKYANLKITKAEDAYIQMLGELRGNPDTELTEKVVNEYYEKHKNKIDKAKVEKVIEFARQDYDNLLNRVNEALRAQGMKEIPYRQGYFPHFTEPKQNFIQKLLNWKTQDNEIPTSIAGLTEDFKPVKSWQSFDKQRYSDTTDYSFLKGFDNYSEGALDWIYHIDTLQKRRAVENYIRYTHSEEGIKAKIKEVYANEEIDADKAQARIEEILKEARNPLNNFVQDFMTHTNILAGKKHSLDRGWEQGLNRNIYSIMTNVQNRTSANMVLANVRSALTNFIPITQSWAQVSPLRSLQATKDTIANAIKDDGMINKSTFLTNRLREADKLYKTNWDKIIDGSGIMFEIVDNISSQVIWRSKYNQNLADGMTESEAIKNADQFAENVMAGRSKGNEPTLFTAKNPLVKAFTMFQLEVNNQYGYFFKDVPNDLKAETNHWKLNLAKGYTTAFVGAYVYNALLEQLTGSDAALDPIGIIEDLLKDLGLFGDDDEEEEFTKEKLTKAGLNFADNVIKEIPLVGNIAGGGRIPISSGIPYVDNGFFGGIEAFVNDVSEGNKSSIDKELQKPFYNLLLPVGGSQLKKTVQGINMFNTDEDHPIAGSYTDSGALRFPVDDTLSNRIQAGIFGQYANKNAREYFDNGYAPLKEKQIDEFMDVDLPIADYWKYREGLSGLKKNSEKADYINSLDIADWQKNLLINNILDRKEDVDMSNYDDYSDFEEFDFAQKNPEKYTLSKAITDDVVKYKQYTGAMYDIKADKDASGKSISGSRKEKVIEYINNLDADYEQKIILFKTEYPSDDTYNEDIINYINNRDDLTFEERVTIYTELGFTVKGDNVYWD